MYQSNRRNFQERYTEQIRTGNTSPLLTGYDDNIYDLLDLKRKSGLKLEKKGGGVTNVFGGAHIIWIREAYANFTNLTIHYV